MSDELKPCPFCGGSPRYPDYDAGDNDYVVMCADCGAHSIYGDKQNEVIAAWNRRTPPSGEAWDRSRRAVGWWMHYNGQPEYVVWTEHHRDSLLAATLDGKFSWTALPLYTEPPAPSAAPLSNMRQRNRIKIFTKLTKRLLTRIEEISQNAK